MKKIGTKTIPFEQTRRLPQLDPRQGHLDFDVVSEYAQRDPETCPPGKATPLDDGTFAVLAGHHRMAARRQQGLEFLEFELYEGAERDLYRLAFEDNLDAKVPYTTKQKQDAVEHLLDLGFQPTEITTSLKGAVGKNFTDKIKRVHLARELIGPRWTKDGKMLDRWVYFELYTAPEEYRDRLADAAAAFGWNAKVTLTAVQGIKNGEYDEDTIEMILAGEIPPYRVDKEGNPQVHGSTVTDAVAASMQRNQTIIELTKLIEHIAHWRTRYHQNPIDWDQVDDGRIRKIDELLGKAAETIGDVRMDIHNKLYTGSRR